MEANYTGVNANTIVTDLPDDVAILIYKLVYDDCLCDIRRYAVKNEEHNSWAVYISNRIWNDPDCMDWVINFLVTLIYGSGAVLLLCICRACMCVYAAVHTIHDTWLVITIYAVCTMSLMCMLRACLHDDDAPLHMFSFVG